MCFVTGEEAETPADDRKNEGTVALGNRGGKARALQKKAPSKF